MSDSTIGAYDAAAESRQTVCIEYPGRESHSIEVLTSGFRDNAAPVIACFGPLALSLNPRKAIELGQALIRAGHHVEAARAAVTAPGGEA